MATLEFEPVNYENLNPAQQENYNYHKVSARLADFGYTTIRLHDDFEGADFIAKHVRKEKLLKVQLKGRLTFDKKYLRREVEDQICIAFREGRDWYVYPHDDVFDEITSQLDIINGTKSWREKGTYHIGSMTDEQRSILEPHRLPQEPGASS
jgi:hypothetical protein